MRAISGHLFAQMVPSRRNARYAEYTVNYSVFRWFYEPMVVYIRFSRGVFAALGVGVFPITVLVLILLFLGVDFGGFVCKVAARFCNFFRTASLKPSGA